MYASTVLVWFDELTAILKDSFGRSKLACLELSEGNVDISG